MFEYQGIIKHHSWLLENPLSKCITHAYLQIRVGLVYGEVRKSEFPQFSNGILNFFFLPFLIKFQVLEQVARVDRKEFRQWDPCFTDQ